MPHLVLTPDFEHSEALTETQREALWAWVRANLPDAGATYRTEIDLVHRTATVHEYERGQDGRLSTKGGTREVAKRAPYTVWLTSLPPYGLWVND